MSERPGNVIAIACGENKKNKMLTQSRVEKQITGKEKIDSIGTAWNECKDFSKVVFCKNSNGQPGELKVKKESLRPEGVISWTDRIRRGGLGRNIEIRWLSNFKYRKTWRMQGDDAL